MTKKKSVKTVKIRAYNIADESRIVRERYPDYHVEHTTEGPRKLRTYTVVLRRKK